MFPQPKPIEKEVLQELYVNQRKTIEEICEYVGVKSPITVAKYMRIHGIIARDANHERSLLNRIAMSDTEFKSVLIKMYVEDHKSLNQISHDFKVSPRIVRKYLDRFGIEVKKQREAVREFNSGSRNPKWSGGRTSHSDGYRLIYCPEHPHSDQRGYVYEHRLVVEAKLGRILETTEHVHHINGNKVDNRPENLMVVSNEEHPVIHGRSGIKGVRWHKATQKWAAVDPATGKHIGLFETVGDAANALPKESTPYTRQ